MTTPTSKGRAAAADMHDALARKGRKGDAVTQAFDRQRAEIERRLALLATSPRLTDAGPKTWPAVGTLEAINERLAQALHWAGVAEFVER